MKNKRGIESQIVIWALIALAVLTLILTLFLLWRKNGTDLIKQIMEFFRFGR